MNLKQKLSRKLKKTGGFTLIEMLIVVAIIAILVAVSIPMVGSSLEKAKTATDDANVRAAKAAAMIEFLMSDPVPTTATTYYYDAANGTIVDNKPTTGYNQAKKDDIAANGAVVQIIITPAATGDTTVQTNWVAKGT